MKISIQEDINPIEIMKSINDKYSVSNYFFTSKYINQLIYSVGNSLSIQFQYLKYYDDDIQYLRRTYRHVGLNGKKQIEQRIKLVSKYYEDNDMISSQIPMMIVTKMKDIFVKRAKRLKRLKKNNQDSKTSKQESSFGSGSLSFSIDQDFLKELHLHFSELMNQSSSQYNLAQIKFDEQVHMVYDNSQNENQQIQQQNVNLKEKIIDHLVCDFGQIDVEGVINFYKDIKKSKNGSIIMSEIIQEQHKLSKKNFEKQLNQNKNMLHLQYPLEKNKKSSSISKQSVLSSYISIFGPKSKSKQPKQNFTRQNKYSNHLLIDRCVDDYKKKWKVNIQNAEEQIDRKKSQLKQNRQKVRQKAQKLLQKIQKQSFTTQIR